MNNNNHKENDKKNDGKFSSKNIKHNPQAESARAVFGLNDKTNKADSAALIQNPFKNEK